VIISLTTKYLHYEKKKGEKGGEGEEKRKGEKI